MQLLLKKKNGVNGHVVDTPKKNIYRVIKL